MVSGTYGLITDTTTLTVTMRDSQITVIVKNAQRKPVPYQWVCLLLEGGGIPKYIWAQTNSHGKAVFTYKNIGPYTQYSIGLASDDIVELVTWSIVDEPLNSRGTARATISP